MGTGSGHDAALRRHAAHGGPCDAGCADIGKTHPFFSNLGVLDPAWVDFGDVPVADAYGVGPVLYPPGFFLALSTFRGVLTLATSFCHTAVDARCVAQCFDLTLAELPE